MDQKSLQICALPILFSCPKFGSWLVQVQNKSARRSLWSNRWCSGAHILALPAKLLSPPALTSLAPPSLSCAVVPSPTLSQATAIQSVPILYDSINHGHWQLYVNSKPISGQNIGWHILAPNQVPSKKSCPRFGKKIWHALMLAR